MRYLCIVCCEEKTLNALTKSEDERLTAESLAYDEELKQSGHLIVAHALQRVETATTLRMRNSKLLTTDGPFAETKEQLGGFILIEARDLNEAIQLGSRIPLARLGCIEVRPIMELEPR